MSNFEQSWLGLGRFRGTVNYDDFDEDEDA